MLYKKFKPLQELSFFIECYYVWESNSTDIGPIEVESPPNGFTSFGFNTGSEYFATTFKNDAKKVPFVYVAGQNTHSYKLCFPGKIAISGIVFKPTGISSLFQIPMYSLTEERVDLNKFLSASVIDPIVVNMTEAQNADQKAKILEDFIYSIYLEKEPVPDVIDLAANLIVEKHGLVNIDEICSQFFISRRHFERKFLQKVGLSAKYYARLRRMSYLCSQIAGKKKVNWKDVLYEAEFCNQSHFIRDFIEFTGRSPKEYLLTNKELIHVLK
ncbi:MAG: helix-turn-helix domain-containing protein [Flavisolibacter sp.]